MSREKDFMRLKIFLAILFVSVLMTGCGDYLPQEKFYEYRAPKEKLGEIEMLDLSGAKVAKGIDELRGFEDYNEGETSEIALSLEMSRAMAMKYNLSLKVQLIEPAISEERLKEEQAKFEPSFFSNFRFSKTDTPTASLLSGSKVSDTVTNIGVDIPLQSGGTVRFSADDERLKTNNQFSTLNPAYSSDASFSISQPLLRNAGGRVNRHTIRIADYENQRVNALTKLEVIRIIANVDISYWRVYAARQELEVRIKEFELAKAQLERARNFVQSGERSAVEVVRAEAGVAQRLEGIIIAENNLRDRQRELKRTLNIPGIEMSSDVLVVPDSEPELVYYELDKQAMTVLAMEQRMELLELELLLASDASVIDFARNQTLPLVLMDYRYNVNGLGSERSNSADMLFERDFEDHQVGLQLVVPLGNKAAKSRLRQAFYQRQMRLATKQRRELLIEQEVLAALDQLEANWQRILASRQNSILSGRLLEAERRQFELGLRTSTDVLEAQANLADAQSAEIQALTEYQIALVDLAYATGTLLGAAEIEIEPIVPEHNIN